MSEKKGAFLHLLALGSVLAGLFLIGMWMHKTITLVIDGEQVSRDTFALTVGQLLQAEKIQLQEKDVLLPPTGRWLREGETVSIEKASHIVVQADGNTHFITTAENLPANLLAALEIPLYPEDRLLVNGKPAAPHTELSPAPSHSLVVKRAFPVRLSTGAEVLTIHSSAATLGQALWEAGIKLHAGDRLDPAPETPLDGPIQASLKPSQELRIRFQGEQVLIRSAAETIGEALAENGIALQGLDYSVPLETEPLPPKGLIRIVRVQESVALETEPMPFETKSQPVPELAIDRQDIVQPGAYGLAARRVRVRYEDGQEVSRQVEAEYVAQEPQERIVGYGTKIAPLPLAGSGGLTYWRALNMYAVSYNPTSAGGTITASGLPLEKGVVAVDPNYIPLGTRLYIPGYGEAVAADTGGGVKGRMIDLGYSDSDYVPWHQWVTVYFLWPPPAEVVWIIP